MIDTWLYLRYFSVYLKSPFKFPVHCEDWFVYYEISLTHFRGFELEDDLAARGAAQSFMAEGGACDVA